MQFFDLPPELKLAVFKHCDVKTLAIAAGTCKEWQALISDDNLWKIKVEKLIEKKVLPNPRRYISWKEIYIDTYKALQALADMLYKVIFEKKTKDRDLTSDYANEFIEDIIAIYEEAISETGLTKILLAKYPTILTKEDNDNHTLLHWLAASSLPEAVKIVLDKAKTEQTRIYSLNEEEGYRLVDSRNIECFTPIHFALINCPQERHDNLVKIVELFTQYEADFKVTDAVSEINFSKELDNYWEGGLIDDEHYEQIRQLIKSSAPAAAM
jgi:ankyrin repeat protein